MCIIAYNRDFGYLFISTRVFVYLFISQRFYTSQKARKNSQKNEKNISKKPRNSQHTSYPFSSFTMMRAALSGAEV